MNQIPHQESEHYISKEEISLIDLSKILIRQWKIIVATFMLVVLSALAFVLITDRSYEYVSIYQVAEQAPGSALEAPNTVLAKVSNLYIGPVTRELRESEGLDSLPFEVTVTNPNNTLLIRLSSEAKEADSNLVTQMHEALQARMIESQEERLEKQRNSLEQQLQSTERVLRTAEQSSGDRASELIVSYTENLAKIQEQISQLNEGEVVQTAVQSLEPTGTSRKLMMVLAVVIGGVLAIIVAFFLHFALLVRDSFSNEAH